MSARIYKNTKRVGSKGTQSEAPSLAAIDSETFKVGGYQRFQISNKKVVPTGGYKGKFEFIRKFLHDHGKDCNSVSDIGSSTGLVAFTKIFLVPTFIRDKQNSEKNNHELCGGANL